MHFTKMQGLGNDYLYVFGEVPDNVAELSRKLSDRHFGAGSDGMIYISRSSAADFRMRIFNADGSEAAMCGNGIRCVGKYVYDKGYTDRTSLTVETMSGIRTLEMQVRSGRVRSVTVGMGAADVGDELSVEADGRTVTGTPVSVGNPHFVIFVDDIDEAPLYEMGPLIEKHVPGRLKKLYPSMETAMSVYTFHGVARLPKRSRVWLIKEGSRLNGDVILVPKWECAISYDNGGHGTAPTPRNDDCCSAKTSH